MMIAHLSSSPDGRLRFRPTAVGDADQVTQALRDVDRLDIQAFTTGPPATVVPLWLERSRKPFTLEFDGRAAAVGGLVLRQASPTTIWAIGSAGLDSAFQTGLLRHSRTWFRRYAADAGVLDCFPAAANTSDIRWLQWLGFRQTHRLHSRVQGGVDCLRLQFDPA